MARKRPARRRQRFEIEPLNWVAPEDARDEAQEQTNESNKSTPPKEAQQ